MLEGFIKGLGDLLTPNIIIAILIGTAIGWVFGIIPGLQSITALVVMLPFTYGWDPIYTMYLFAGIIGASGQGGAITSILLNMPGTAQNAATMLEGFPLTKQGKGSWALGVSASASMLGAAFGLVSLIILMPFFIPFLLAFGPAEIFAIMVLGLVSMSIALPGNFVKTLVSICLGIALSAIGFGGPTIAFPRFTFGSSYLLDGLELTIVLMGLLVMSEAVGYLIPRSKNRDTIDQNLQSRELNFRLRWKECFSGMLEPLRWPLLLLRSSTIGTIIGATPGVGGVVAQFLSYNAAYASSRNQSKFGQGAVEGLIAAEAATNSKEGGTLLPTLLFGIPGNGEMALVLAAWLMQGLQPGPFFLKEHADLAWALILGLFFSNLFSSGITAISSSIVSRIPQIRVDYVGATVLITTILAVFAVRKNFWDIALVCLLGLIGFVQKNLGFSVIGTVIGFILGGIMEDNFYTALQSSRGNSLIFLTSPISAVLLLITFLSILWHIFRKKAKTLPSKSEAKNE